MPQPLADQFRSIPMTPNLGQSLERAHAFAREQGHRAVTLEHLLLAFTEDPDASAVLQASTVDIVRLGTDVSGYLGRLLEDMRAENGAEPQADPELLRVLHAAVQAAQQSRRRQIDGAIVLAAVVGDGKSPAAGLLKAHGLTFEEAIRALQKANAKASAQARSKQFATSAPSAAPAGAAVSRNNSDAALSKRGPALEPLNVREPQATGQSVDDILAAARARIQQRTAGMTGKTADLAQSPVPVSEPPSQPEPDLAQMPTAEAAAPLEPEPVPAADPPGMAPPIPTEPPPIVGTSSGRAPPPLKQMPVSRLPPAPTPRQPPAPFSARALEPGSHPPRPQPPPGRAGAGPLPPQPGLPNRPRRAPWPDTEAGMPVRPAPLTNGAVAESGLAGAPAVPQRRPGQRTAGQGGQGPLVETIPRRMRAGIPAAAHVRISRDRIDSLILLLMKGRGMAHRPDAFVARAFSVRLRAPDGGFWIEAASPETQWIDSASPGDEDHVGWRWTVTPQRRGRGRLVLAVTARTIGQDGLAAEMSPPDRVIEVAVTGGRLRWLWRWMGFVVALILGAVLGRFAGEFWALGMAILKKVLG